MPPLSRPRVRRITRTLLLCGVSWMALCWSYGSYYIWSSLPPKTHYSPSSIIASSPASIGGGIKENGLQEPETVFSSEQSRHLSSSVHDITASSSNNIIASQIIIENNEHPYLRPINELAPSSTKQQPSSLLVTNQSATPPLITSLIYPLHAKSGTHHAYLYIGTPPQRQTLIVDTGSRLTAFPCHPHCPECGSHASVPFHLNISSSHDVLSCTECRLTQADFPLEEYFFGRDGMSGNSGDGGPPASGLRGTGGNLDQRQHQRSVFPSSCVNNQCGLDQKYTEGSSWKAFEVRDKVWLGLNEQELSVEEHDKYSAPFVFGCQVSEQGLFKTQYADGIMGLSMYTQTLVGTWLHHRSIPHPSFSLCLNQKGGHIALGGAAGLTDYNPLLPEQEQQQQQHTSGAGRSEHLAPMQFTPFAKENVWYYTVTVTCITVGKHVLPKSILQFVNDHKGTIVDSGTTDTFISHKVAKPFTSAWEKTTGRKYTNRLQKYTYEQFKELPIITFELEGGILWEITPEAYMEKAASSSNSLSSSNGNDINKNNETTATNINDNNPNSENKDKRWGGKQGFISRVYVDEPQGVVLGSNAMMDKEIYFDIPNKRLGVARAKCAY